MLSGRELALGIVGAWRLVRADRTALLCFDRTPRGFWRSFWVALILAPVSALLVAIHLADLKIVDVSARIVLLQMGFVALNWLAMPALLSEIAQRTGRVPQFMAYVIANNYAQILGTGFWLAALVLAVSVPAAIGSVLLYGALGGLLFYQYRIARVAFELRPLFAAALVIAEFALQQFLLAINDGLLQAFVPAGV